MTTPAPAASPWPDPAHDPDYSEPLNPASWPDPNCPGVPLNPEQDGWHIVERYRGVPICISWDATWHKNVNRGWGNHQQPDRMHRWTYVSPVHTDADLATTARVHATASAGRMREACATMLAGKSQLYRDCANGVLSASEGESWRVGARTLEAAVTYIRAIPIPDTDALEAVIAEAEAKERERIARWFEDRAAMMEKEASENDGFGKTTAMLCRSYAEAVRAGETTDAG